MATSFQSEIEQVLREDSTTSKLIKSLADKENSTPEQVTTDVSKLFAEYGRFLVAKEGNSPTADAVRSASKNAVSEFLEKYGLKSDMVESVMDKMAKGLPSSDEIPSSDTISRDGDKNLGKGKKFKIFLICAAAVLMVMNIVKKAKK